MADQSNIFDMGGAISTVRLTTWGSNIYESDGITPKTIHVGGYQEAWFDTQANQTNQASRYSRLFPAEHWLNQWDVVNTSWRQVPHIGGLALNYNQTPDAPNQTLCFGRVGVQSTDIPDICVAGLELAPVDGQYIETDPNVGPSIPGGSGSSQAPPDTSDQPIFDPVMVGGNAIPQIQNGLQEQLFADTPFKPSSVDFIARRKNKSTANADWYINQIRTLGLPLYNVWDMSSPNKSADGRTYIRNYGPSWGNTNYAGPQFSQEGGIGNLRVRISANKGVATMRRVAPLNKCIGRDIRFPWIFPYVDNTQLLSHEIQVSRIIGVETGIDKMGKEIEGKPIPNIGFLLDMDITSESQRGSFFGSGGSSPQVMIQWGGALANPYRPQDPWQNDTSDFKDAGSEWATGFQAYIAPNKVPYVRYWDGQKTATAYLAESPIPALAAMQFKVEYFGTSMIVSLGDKSKEICIRGYSQKGVNETRKGVYVTNNSVSMQVSNCTVTFSCMPIYYNPWSTSQDAGFIDGDVSTALDAASKNNTDPSNNKFEFWAWQQQGDDLAHLFAAGLAKLNNMAIFHLPPSRNTSDARSQATTLVNKVITNLTKQSPNTTQIKEQTDTWGDMMVPANNSGYYHTDEGWPALIRDSRQNPCDGINVATCPLQLCSSVFPSKVGLGYNWLTAQPMPTPDWPGGTGSPTQLSTDTTTVSMLFCVNTTHTTPIIFGFKADGVHNEAPFLPEQVASETLKATNWVIQWSASGGSEGTVSKVMKASADVTIVDPSANALFALANNQMKLIIEDTGYPGMASNIPSGATTLRRAIYNSGRIFEGITTSVRVSRTSSGKVVAVIHAVDPILMLEMAMLESNLRFDGNSYVMAICNLMRHTDYVNIFELRFGNTTPGTAGTNGVLVGPTWLGGKRIEQLLSNLNIKIPYFGYQPGIGRSYEASPGTFVMVHITNILNKMISPAFMPLFYYDPTTHKFVLTHRLRTPHAPPGGLGADKDGRLWIIDAPQGVNTNAWDASSIMGGLLLQANKGGPLYSLESSTAHLSSHCVGMGNNRITGTPLKGTAMNPNWNSLATASTSAGWASVYGHMGYRAKVLETGAKGFLPDQYALNTYIQNRMWWLMRPAMRISELTVDGVVFPGSGGDLGGIADGSLGVVIGQEQWLNTVLENVTITYDAVDQRVQSKISVAVFPPSIPGTAYGKTPASGK